MSLPFLAEDYHDQEFTDKMQVLLLLLESNEPTIECEPNEKPQTLREIVGADELGLLIQFAHGTFFDHWSSISLWKALCAHLKENCIMMDQPRYRTLPPKGYKGLLCGNCETILNHLNATIVLPLYEMKDVYDIVGTACSQFIAVEQCTGCHANLRLLSMVGISNDDPHLSEPGGPIVGYKHKICGGKIVPVISPIPALQPDDLVRHSYMNRQEALFWRKQFAIIRRWAEPTRHKKREHSVRFLVQQKCRDCNYATRPYTMETVRGSGGHLEYQETIARVYHVLLRVAFGFA